MKDLIKQMVEDAIAVAEDSRGPHKPCFFQQKVIAGDSISFCLEESRDPSKSNNGGEYYQYARYLPVETGVLRYEVSSYEDDEGRNEEVFPVCLSLAGIKRMAVLACEKALRVIKPRDYYNLRQRVVFLRIKSVLATSSNEDLYAIGAFLGVVHSDTTLKGIVDLGLSLAESGRRDYGDLKKYWDLVEERIEDAIIFTDAEDGREYTMSLQEIPYMGNKSARMDTYVL